MTEPMTQVSFILECQRLHQAQLDATTPEDREAADAELAHFMAMNAMGRLQEYFENRKGVA